MKIRYWMFVGLVFVFAVVFLTGSSFTLTHAVDIAEEKQHLNQVKNLLAAKERAWQIEATASDIETVLDFYSDSLVYDHVFSPSKRFTFNGKDLLRRGMVSHLGETRNVKLKMLKSIVVQNVVIVEGSMYRETKTSDGWKVQSSQNGVSIFEFDEKNKIRHIVEYL